MNREPIPQAEALKLQLACIGGAEPASSYFELRPLTRDGRPAPSERTFIPVRELHAAAERVRALADRLNVFVAAAPRVREDGTAAAVERAWCLWADLDGRDALKRLRDFRPLPSVVVRSGSANCAHAYWPLRRPLEPSWAQRANRRLALALGGDMSACDPARILRAAGTLNFKSDSPRPVLCTRLELAVFTFHEVVGGLPDTSHYAVRDRPRRAGPTDDAAAIAGLARFVAEAARGERNKKLYWAGCRLAEHHLPGGEDLLRDAALQAGLPEHEVMRTLHSARTAVAA